MTEIGSADREATAAGRKRVMAWTVRTVMILGAISGIAITAVNIGGLTSATNVPKHQGSGGSLFYHAIHERSFRDDGAGHFYINANLGDQQLRFLLDKNTRTVVLSPNDAHDVGLTTGALTYSTRLATPDGELRAAPVTIKMLTVNEVTLFNVDAAIAEHPLAHSILGASFLKRFQSYDMQNGKLVLRW